MITLYLWVATFVTTVAMYEVQCRNWTSIKPRRHPGGIFHVNKEWVEMRTSESRFPMYFDWYITTVCKHTQAYDRRYTAATQHTSNMAAVTILDRMTSLSRYVYKFVYLLTYLIILEDCDICSMLLCIAYQCWWFSGPTHASQQRQRIVFDALMLLISVQKCLPAVYTRTTVHSGRLT